MKCASQTGARVTNAGFTLLEMLIAIAIVAIIVTVAMPNMSEVADTQRLIGATEQVYAHLQQARSEAVSRNTNTFVNFAVDGTGSWEYGISMTSLCDLTVTSPTTADACVLVVNDGDAIIDPGDGSLDTGDLVLSRFNSTDYNDSLLMDIASFSSGSTQFVFNSLRGTATSGQVNLTSANGRNTRVSVSLIGRVTMCTPDDSVNNYSAC